MRKREGAKYARIRQNRAQGKRAKNWKRTWKMLSERKEKEIEPDELWPDEPGEDIEE